jgi:hypothetical protein
MEGMCRESRMANGFIGLEHRTAKGYLNKGPLNARLKELGFVSQVLQKNRRFLWYNDLVKIFPGFRG